MATNLGLVRGSPERKQSELPSDFVAQSPRLLVGGGIPPFVPRIPESEQNGGFVSFSLVGDGPASFTASGVVENPNCATLTARVTQPCAGPAVEVASGRGEPSDAGD